MKTTLIAPCGMNCRLCRAYGRDKDPCAGCRDDEIAFPGYRGSCRIKNCGSIVSGRLRFCSPSCEDYPCRRLRDLDKRYRTRYGMSMIENLEVIDSFGVREFVRREKERWACPGCDEVLCVHQEACPGCGQKWR